MTRTRILAVGLALMTLAGSAHAMGGRKKRKKPAPPADPMAEGLKRVEVAKQARADGKDELARRAFEKAAEHFAAATQAAPEDPEAWNQLGFARREAGDYRNALHAYTKALELRPGYAEAIEYQAEAYLGLKTYPAVMKAHRTLTQAGDQEAAATLMVACKQHLTEGHQGAVGYDGFVRWVRLRSKMQDRMKRPGTEKQGKRW